MKSILTLLLILILFPLTKAQDLSRNQLDSLYNKFLQIRGIKIYNNNLMHVLNNNNVHIKCGFGIANEVRMNYNKFTTEQKSILKTLLNRPTSDTSFVTPNGFFRVHFTKSDFPNYIPPNVLNTITPGQLQAYKEIYLDSLAIALDSAYNFEVNFLGYPPPPSDNGDGGDNKYDIYISNSIPGEYGETDLDTQIPGTNRYSSYMIINSNFTGFYTQGIYAARVTVAHEFHHSIQIGDYIYRYDSDEFFYELTSTSMEHFVYPSIHDYYQYLPAYFNDTQFSLGRNFGYNNQEYALAIWNIFLQENFGYGIIKKQWQLMPQMRALQAISNSLIDYNTSFGTQFNKFGTWIYFTNYRATNGYFASAKDYPIVKPVSTLQIIPPSKTVQMSTYSVTNTYIRFVNPANNDTLVSLITNADIAQGIDSLNNILPFQYTLYAQGSENFSYSDKFSAAKPAFWLVSGFLNNKPFESGKYFVENNDFAFPAPFYYSKNSYIYIPVKPDASDNVNLNIYSISMNLVYSKLQTVGTPVNGKYVIVWNALDNQGKKLPTGVYIYVTKSGGNTTKGKLVIFDE